MGDAYAEISNTEADMQQTYRAQLVADTKWTFQNQTPFKIKLTYRPLHVDPAGSNLSYRAVFLGTLDEKHKTTFTIDAKGRALMAGRQRAMAAGLFLRFEFNFNTSFAVPQNCKK